MAKGYEERFPYSKMTYHLKQFLLNKVKQLEKEIASELIVKKKAGLAEHYIAKIKDILEMSYFSNVNLDQPVYQLMEQLKQDCKSLQKKTDELQVQIHAMERRLENDDEFNLRMEYVIPDEVKIQQEAIARKRYQYALTISAVREEHQLYKYKLELCRNLQGIVARPEGFFNALYKV